MRSRRLNSFEPGCTHNATNRKIFLIGESFGGYRAGGVALRLERSGQDVAGVILISGGVASGPLIPSAVRAALVTPQRTAAALALGRIAGRSDEAGVVDVRTATVRAATQWSLDTYLPALTYVHDISAKKRAEVAAQLSEFTGYPAGRIDQRTLVITTKEYLDAMSPTAGKSLSEYDMRTTAPPRIDDRAIGRYYRSIGVRNGPIYWDMDASDPLHPTGKGWTYDYIWSESAKWGSSYAEPWLPAAMKINPQLKVYVAAGLYDALNSCAENDVLVSMLEPDLAKNYTVRCYLAGHIMYTDPRVRHELSRDIPAFVRAVLFTGG